MTPATAATPHGHPADGPRAATTAVTTALNAYTPGSPDWTRMADALEWLTLNAELAEAGMPPLTAA